VEPPHPRPSPPGPTFVFNSGMRRQWQESSVRHPRVATIEQCGATCAPDSRVEVRVQHGLPPGQETGLRRP